MAGLTYEQIKKIASRVAPLKSYLPVWTFFRKTPPCKYVSPKRSKKNPVAAWINRTVSQEDLAWKNRERLALLVTKAINKCKQCNKGCLSLINLYKDQPKPIEYKRTGRKIWKDGPTSVWPKQYSRPTGWPKREPTDPAMPQEMKDSYLAWLETEGKQTLSLVEYNRIKAAHLMWPTEKC